MMGSSGGPQYHNPDLQAQLQQQQAERNRKLTEAATREKQNQINADQATNNDLSAQRFALDQSAALQSDSSNPRTVHDTSMSISNGGASGSASSASRQLPQGGFGGNGAPNIDGRYMSLVGFTPPPLNEAPPLPQVKIGTANFGPADASAYQNAQFGQKKAQAGQMGKSAIDSLVAQLAGRGISNSGTLGRGIGDRLSLAQQPLIDLNVAHLGQDYAAAQHERDLSENARMTEYSGGIQQRGQDASMMAALNSLKAQLASTKYSGELQQRGQNLDALYKLL